MTFTTKNGYFSFLVLILLFISSFSFGSNESSIESYGTGNGFNAPMFNGTELSGKAINLNDYAGENLLLVFASPGCPHCKKKVPLLNSIVQDGDLKVVMVISANAEQATEFKQKYEAKFDIIPDSEYKISQTYGIRSVPQGFLIEGEGTIISSTISDGRSLWSQLVPQNAEPSISVESLGVEHSETLGQDATNLSGEIVNAPTQTESCTEDSDCDLDLGCSVDYCGADGYCVHIAKPNFCLIKMQTYYQCAVAGVELWGECSVCDPSQNQYKLTPVNEDLSCYLGMACVTTGNCKNGYCSTIYAEYCDDGLDCTIDCKDGDCKHYRVPNHCIIDGQCYENGDVNPENPCQQCNWSVSTHAWVNNNNLSCDDGVSCTKDDYCVSGTCTGVPYSCDDGLECTIDTCYGDGGCSHTIDNEHCFINGQCIAPGTISPSNQCQSCIPSISKTTWSNSMNSCNDGDSCTRNDVCSNGTCGGTPFTCNDGLTCTTDICNGNGSCTYNIQSGKCLINGVCYNRYAVNPANPCQECRDDWGSQYKTQWYNDNSNSCNDASNCTYGDHCSSGSCVSTAYTCNDGLACTTDTCNGDGSCTYTLNSGYCLINGSCYSRGTLNPSNPCQECRDDMGSQYKTQWYNDNTNPGVNDWLSCTTDTCNNGTTIHTIIEGKCLIGTICYSRGESHPIQRCNICRDDINPYSWYDTDIDNDNACDNYDNCPRMYNPQQEDFDENGRGDKCDPFGLLNVWGYNVYHQSDGEPSGGGYVQVEAGYYHATALKDDGTIVGWGKDDYGQVSGIPAGTDFVVISSKCQHGLALKQDGSVVGWGLNDYGQASPPLRYDIAAIATGYFHSIALTESGEIIAWGRDNYNQLVVPAGNDFIAISANMNHCIALRSDGSICSWGNDTYGQVSDTPSGNDFIDISAGFWHSLALKSDGSIVAWGQSSTTTNLPPTGNNYVAIAAGNSSNLALRGNGTVAGWGINNYNQIIPPAGDTYTDISSGYYFSAVIYNCKTMYRGDINFDCYADLTDLQNLSLEWLESTEPMYADIDASSEVNFDDFVIFADDWLKCSHPIDTNCQ
ncbi:MAG: hypothetical protein A2Y10_00600 [Planctomycetes bacterium GWF2_41_51]|nr:MAG: hypothetical protein A2Y10_00600 [Planctomycetes bacterium GWF2_41_51]HBG28855.1 hypothetical protein [Phycisphaerales bacterium]